MRGKQYRLVKEQSPRGQVTEQVLGNCAVEDAEYDGSAGMALFLAARRPTPPDPAT